MCDNQGRDHVLKNRGSILSGPFSSILRPFPRLPLDAKVGYYIESPGVLLRKIVLKDVCELVHFKNYIAQIYLSQLGYSVKY